MKKGIFWIIGFILLYFVIAAIFNSSVVALLATGFFVVCKIAFEAVYYLLK